MRPTKQERDSERSLIEGSSISRHSSKIMYPNPSNQPQEQKRSWMNYSHRLQKQVQSLKSQIEDLQMLLSQKNKQLQKHNKQIQYYRVERQRSLASTEIHQNQYLKQQLSAANRLAAEIKAENEWLKSKIQTKGQEKQPESNLKMEEEMRNLRYSYEIFQKKMLNLMDDVSKYQSKCEQLTQENQQLRILTEKGSSQSKSLNQSFVKSIKGLEQNFRMYLGVRYFDEENQQKKV